MQGKQVDLEANLLRGSKIDLAQGALIASGVNNERVLAQYLAQIEQLCLQIGAEAVSHHSGDLKKAKSIFDWLWRAKPRRYQYQGNFKLTDVLDAQLGEKDEVGNCLGLTLLFNELIADIYHSIANSLFEQRELELAIESYDKAIRLNPEYTKARLNKGIALVESGRVAEAREWFRERGGHSSSASAAF
jgi:tetratricopeptide (TPR) repeat protein